MRQDGWDHGAIAAGTYFLIHWRGLLLAFVLTLLLVLGVEKAAHATAGNLDPSFGSNGKQRYSVLRGSDFGNDLAVQLDGKLVIVGSSEYSDAYDFSVVRLNENGSFDGSFSEDGRLATDIGSSNDEATAVGIQEDGKLVVGGSSNCDFALVRYHQDGRLDTTFGASGKVTTPISSSGYCDGASDLAIQADGKIVLVGGSAQNASYSDYDVALARYNQDGSLDQTFGNAGKVVTSFGSYDDFATAVGVHADGSIVVTGYYYLSPGSVGTMLAKYGPDGTSLKSTTISFGSGNSEAHGLDIQDDGKTVIGGLSVGPSDWNFALARFNADGNLDTSFGIEGKVTTDFNSGSYDSAHAVAVQPDGKIVAGGISEGSFALARYSTSGTLDAGFGMNGKVTTRIEDDDNRLLALEVTGKDKIVAAGSSRSSINGQYYFALARYYGNEDIDLSAVSDFRADAGENRIGLSWNNPPQSYYESTRILRSTSSYASKPDQTDNQTRVYEGAGTSYADEGLTNGTTYYYTAFAKDTAGNWSVASTASAVPEDITLPHTVINSGPNGLTNSNTPTFAFSGSDNITAAVDLVYSYKVDGNSWSEYSSATSVTLGGTAGLADGVHTFYVKAKDETGNVDDSPAEQSFTIDTAAPSTTISSGPSGTIKDTLATFMFSSSEEGSTFRCRLDDEATFSACASPKEYVGLADGYHSFRVKAIDAAGNVGPVASRRWKVDTTKPVIFGLRPLPGTTVVDRTPTIAATVRDAGTNLAKANITMFLDGQRITTFSYDRSKDRLTYTPDTRLFYGRHTVKISARDDVGLRTQVVWGFKVIR